MGNVLIETDPNSHPITYTYDAIYRTRVITDAEGNASKFIWDPNSNLTEFVDGNQHSTLFGYDELNRVITITNAETETTRYGYDPIGNQTELVEADSTITRYGYDPLYRLNTVIENYVAGGPENNDINVLTRYRYDPSGNLAQFIDANGNITQFDNDGMGRVLTETNPLLNTWVFTYDGVGNLHTRLDANGQLTEYAYYPDDKLRRIDYHQHGTFVEFAYDHNNNRTSMLDHLGLTTWTYDPLNRVIALGRALRYSHDAAGNLTGMIYPDGNPVAYTYFKNNWLKTMVDPESNVTIYERDRVGNLTRILNPNSTITDLAYDRADRVLNLVTRQMADMPKTISAFAYSYNDVGHVTLVVNEYGWRNPAVVTETYSYDGLRRLAGMQDSEGVAMAYAYDKVGNRLEWTTNDDLTSQTPFDGFSATYTYNAANQLTTATIDADQHPDAGTFTFAYDRNGNRINREWTGPQGPPIQGTDYTFDLENRLIAAQDYQLNNNRVDRALTTLEYDGSGRRLVQAYDSKICCGGEKRTEYVFDGLDPVVEYSMLNGHRDNYYRGAGGRISAMHHFPAGTLGQMFWYHYNFKGDVAGLTKQDGQSTHNYRYDPYGGVVPDTGNFTDPHNHYTVTGKEYDENMGLVYFGARHYDPRTGVWLTQDTYRGTLANPMSLHRYMYNYDDSINYYDLYGFQGTMPIPIPVPTPAPQLRPTWEPLPPEQWVYAKQAATEFGLPPEFVAAVVVAEQTYDYNIVQDAIEDVLAVGAINIIDSYQYSRQEFRIMDDFYNAQFTLNLIEMLDLSLGVGQVRLSTAREVLRQCITTYELVKQLEDPQRNIRIVAGYLRELTSIHGTSGFSITEMQFIYGAYRRGPGVLQRTDPTPEGRQLSPEVVEYYKKLQELDRR